SLSNPLNATLADAQGAGTIVNDDAPPTVAINDTTVTEGATSAALFTVTLTGATQLPATVDFATTDGTATAGADYTTASGTLTFAPGTTSQQIAVPILNDNVTEVAETFFVGLSNASGATIADNQGVGTIADDEGLPAITISDRTVVEGNA